MPTNTNGGATPLLSAEQFGSYIEKHLTLHDDLVVLGREQLVLRLRVRGTDVSADLARFYNAYREQPAQIDAIARTFARVVRGELPRSDGDYTRLAAQIYPMLKPIELLVTVRERQLPMLVYREFLADLIVTYVIDEANSLSYINENHLERWGVSPFDLHQQALENLRRRTLEQTDYVTSGERDRLLFIFNSNDGYDATRLLLTDILAGWARQIPGNLVIGIPNRDFLIAFSDADGDVLRGIAEQVHHDAREREHGLSPSLFTLAKGQIQVYEWE